MDHAAFLTQNKGHAVLSLRNTAAGYSVISCILYRLICSHFNVGMKAILEEILTEIQRVSPRNKIK